MIKQNKSGQLLKLLSNSNQNLKRMVGKVLTPGMLILLWKFVQVLEVFSRKTSTHRSMRAGRKTSIWSFWNLVLHENTSTIHNLKHSTWYIVIFNIDMVEENCPTVYWTQFQAVTLEKVLTLEVIMLILARSLKILKLNKILVERDPPLYLQIV